MPWGEKSIVQMDPRLSNDGPILWVRPGEQLVPTAELTKTPLKRQRYAYAVNEGFSFSKETAIFSYKFWYISTQHSD